MNETVRVQDKWATISTILNQPITIRSLTSYEWDSKGTGQIGNHQHHSESANPNQTTYPLWMRQQGSRANGQPSAPFWVPNHNQSTDFLWMILAYIIATTEFWFIFKFPYLCMWKALCKCFDQCLLQFSTEWHNRSISPANKRYQNSAQISQCPTINIHHKISTFAFTYLLTAYLMQIIMFECWVVTSNISKASSFKVAAVLSKRILHPLSDLCMSVKKGMHQVTTQQDLWTYSPGTHMLLEDASLPLTFPMQCSPSASLSHIPSSLKAALLEVVVFPQVKVFQ